MPPDSLIAAPAINANRRGRTGLPLAPDRAERREAAATGLSVALRWRLLALLLIVIAAALPRLIEVDRLVTPDEPIWLARSANFNQAMSDRQYQYTYQYAHPGVSVMWLGAIAYQIVATDYADITGQQVSQRRNKIATILESEGYVPLDVLVAGRIAVIIAGLLALAASYWIALRLLGFWEVTLGFLLLALDPFSVALTRLLHVDGLTSLFMLLSVLAALAFLARGWQWRDLAISGVAGALATLTRVQSGIIVVFLALLFLAAAVDQAGWKWPGWPGIWRGMVQPLAVWGAFALATALVVWPAFALDPIGTVRQMSGVVETATIEGHERALYFVGIIHKGDPGWRFYPLALLWRATPVLLIGVALAVAALALRHRFRLAPDHVRIVIGLIGAASVYMGLMTFAAKKFDRYLLPAFAPLMLVAGWGIVTIAKRLGKRLPLPQWAVVATACLFALLVQFQGIIATAPYYLSYYNPMMGGAAAAPSDMMVGWGEGLDQVGSYLNPLPDSEHIVVATEAWPSTINYFFDGTTGFAAFVADRPGVFRWASSDYYAHYITQEQRNSVARDYLEVLEGVEPVHTIHLNGLDYGYLYDIRQQPLPYYMEVGNAGFIDWAGAARLIAAGKPGSVSFPRGLPFIEELYFDKLQPVLASGEPHDIGLQLILVDPDGNELDRSDGPLELAGPGRHGLWSTQRILHMPLDAPGGEYVVQMLLYNMETGKAIRADGDVLGLPLQIPAGMPLETPVGVHFFYVGGSPVEVEQQEEIEHPEEAPSLPE